MGQNDHPADSELKQVEWKTVTDRSLLTRRDWAFLASLSALFVGAIYYSFVHSSDAPLPLLGFWNPLLVDWMFYTSLLIFGFYVVYPLVRSSSLLRRYWTDLIEQRLAIVGVAWIILFLVVGTFKPLFVHNIPFNPIHQPPFGFSLYQGYTGGCLGQVVAEQCRGTLAHPWGTDGNGRDLLLLTIAGMRTALQMALITAAIIVPLGVGVGTFAGYVGGRADEALMRYVDIQQTIPALFVYIALALLYGPSLSLMVVVFGFLNWGDVARVVRSDVLQLREAEFITAAQGAGVGTWNVIRHHVIPNATPSVLSITALKLPLLIIVEATLAYLEFADPRVISWGNIVSVGVISNQDPTIYWWVAAFPIGTLLLTTLAISLVGNALQDVLDPRRTGGGFG